MQSCKQAPPPTPPSCTVLHRVKLRQPHRPVTTQGLDDTVQGSHTTPMASPSDSEVVVTMKDLIVDARDGFHMTARMLAENGIARKLRHGVNLEVNKIATKHLPTVRANQVRWLLASQLASDKASEADSDEMLARSLVLHQHALKVNDGLVGGAVDGARLLNPMDVAMHTRAVQNQALHVQHKTANEFVDWVRTMASVYNAGKENAAFMADLGQAYSPIAARLASISDGEVTALVARNKYLTSRYGAGDTMEMVVENADMFAPGVLAKYSSSV